MKKTKLIAAVLTAVSIIAFLTGCGGSSAKNKQAAAPKNAADSYPSKIVQIIVPFGAGGGADISVRTLAKYAEASLGQKIVIQNITGGSGTVGLTQLAAAAPDGYTLGYFACTNSNDSLLFEGIKYGVDSFIPIIEYSADPHIIVASKKSGITDMASLIAKAKAKPGSMTLSLGGAWTSHDFLRISLEQAENIKFKRVVFQGGAEAVASVASGDCDIAVPFVSEAIPQIEAGNIVPIAITSASRFDVVPSIPTITEQGINFSHTMWRGLVAPAGTPQDIIEKLTAAFETAWNNPEYQAKAKEAGTMTEFKKGADFMNFYLANHESYKKMIESGLN